MLSKDAWLYINYIKEITIAHHFVPRPLSLVP